ncbi:hypothetical protein SVIOM74S_04150 [Streptomyces violarus]
MTTFLDNIFNGLALGAVYALVALGFVIIFKASGVMNFAHGSLLLLGGYLTAVFHDDLGFAGALAVAVLVTAAVAGAMDRFCSTQAGPTRTPPTCRPSSPSASTSSSSPTSRGASAATCSRSATPGATRSADWGR